jgi:hypothetical protein
MSVQGGCEFRLTGSVSGQPGRSSYEAKIWGHLFIPIIDLEKYMIYVISMRRHLRGLAKFVLLAFALSVFTQSLLCGAGSFTKSEASECCRAMLFKCHATEADSACCKHETIAPLHLAITPARLLAPRQPLATVSVLPVAAAAGALLGNQCGHRIFDLFPAHSPPEGVSLFLLLATFLI